MGAIGKTISGCPVASAVLSGGDQRIGVCKRVSATNGHAESRFATRFLSHFYRQPSANPLVWPEETAQRCNSSAPSSGR